MSLYLAMSLYFSFDIGPGSWKSIVHPHREGRVFSVDSVRSELLAGHETENLVRWVGNEVLKGLFVPVEFDESDLSPTQVGASP